ncbi:MAG: glycosyltransferase family 2 protein [Puniceicoccales bacterium]
MANFQKVFNVIRPRMPFFQLVLKHVAFEGEGRDERNRPPVSVTLHLGKRSLECLKVERGNFRSDVRYRKLFRTGKGLKWIKVVAHWADGTESIVSRFLVLNIAKRPPDPFARNYHHFLERNGPKERDFQVLKESVGKLTARPKFSVIMPTFNTDPKLLKAAVGSVMDQIYPEWELCIADDASTRKSTLRTLRKLAAKDSRIRVCYRKENGHISHASNSALEMATGDWISLLDHDDLLLPQSLARVALEINRHPEARFIYSDEDKIDSSGTPVAPYFKPSWNPLFLRSQNYICHFTSIRREDVEAVGRFRPGYEGSQDWDLFLRLGKYLPEGSIRHIPEVLYHWRIIPGSSAGSVGEKSYSVQASRRALEDAIEWKEGASWELVVGMYWVCSPKPCESYDLIRLTQNPAGFWNLASKVSAGNSPVIVFLAEGVLMDNEICSQLAGWANLPEFGIVAGALGDPAGGLAESGVLIHPYGDMSPIFSNMGAQFEGMGRREILPQNLTVPGRWFLAVRRDLWNQFAPLGGNYESWTHRIAGISLLLREEGFSNAMIPSLRLTIDGGIAEADSDPDCLKFRERWPEFCARDPSTNPNLTTEYGCFTLAQDVDVPTEWSFEE